MQDDNQDHKHIDPTSTKETLELLRSIKADVEKDKGVKRDTVVALESYFNDTRDILGPNNGFTTVPSSVGLPSVKEFIDDKILAQSADLATSLSGRVHRLTRKTREHDDEVLKLLSFVQEGLVLSSETTAIAPGTVSRLFEFISDSNTIAFFEAFLKDYTDNATIVDRNVEIIRNILNSNDREGRTDAIIPLGCTSGKLFEVVQDTYGDEKPYASDFLSTRWLLIEMITRLKGEKNQTELLTDNVTIAVRKLTDMLVNPFPEGFEERLILLQGNIGLGLRASKSDEPIELNTSVMVSKEILLQPSVLEEVSSSITQVLYWIESMFEIRGVMVNLVKDSLKLE